MPTPSRKRSVAEIDAVPLPDRVVQGKLTQVGKKYFVTVAGRTRQIPVGVLIPEARIRSLVGKNVSVVYSRESPRSIVAIGTWPTPEWLSARPKFRCVLCYIPAPGIIKRVEESVRDAVLVDLIKAGILSKELGKILGGNPGR
jgi:hypothetical protein